MPSTFCLLSGGGLHFLPYHHNNATDISLTRSDVEEVTQLSNNSSPSPPNAVSRIQTSSSLPGTEPNGSGFIYSSILARKVGLDDLVPGSDCTSLMSNASSSTGYPSPVHSRVSSSSFTQNSSQLIEKYGAHAIYLPDRYIEPSNSGKQNEEIRDMLSEIFTFWNHPDCIEVHELTGGITNMLLECTYKGKIEDPSSETPQTVLIRTYGRGTGMLIDRDREFVSHLVLSSYHMAPQIYARFGNGLVYGFIEGRALKFQELSNNYIYPFIASRMGQWHRTVRVDVIQDSLQTLRRRFGDQRLENSKPNNIWKLLDHWIRILPDIKSIVDVCEDNRDIQQVRINNGSSKHDFTTKEILMEELKWLYGEIGSKSPEVAVHSDLLCGNIIIPTKLSHSIEEKNPAKISSVVTEYRKQHVNPVSFIDYEYMMPGPRAFDIANHFQEWQGFNCDKTLIPKPVRENRRLRKWCSSYLALGDEKASSARVDSLINEISLYYGMPGFYWGVWAGIQSTISLIDFDYLGYSGQRLVEYWAWKRKYLSSK